MADNPFADLVPAQGNPFSDLVPQGAGEQKQADPRKAYYSGNKFDLIPDVIVNGGLFPAGAVAESLSNVPSSLGRVLGDMGHAIMNPIDTAKAIGSVAQGTSNKMGRNAAELVSGEEIEADPERSEAAADAVGAFYKDRYGSLEGIEKTFRNDPAGMLLDASGLGVATRVPKLAQVGRAAEPVTAIKNTAAAAASSVIPESLPQRLYQSAAKFSTVKDQKQRVSMIRTALEEGVMPTAAGVRKLEGLIDVLNGTLDDLISSSSKAGTKVPVNAVFKHLDDLRRVRGGAKQDAAKDLKQIDKFAKAYHEHVSANGITHMTPDELQAFKVDRYKAINYDAKNLKGTPVKDDYNKAVARGAKDTIESEIPEAAGINASLGKLYELQPELGRATNRIANHNLMGIGTPLKMGAGLGADIAGAGGAGTVAAVIASLAENPAMKARVAIAVDRIRRGDTKFLQENAGAPEIRIALALAGQTEEQVNP